MNNRIKKFRSEHDMTQEELANKCDVTRQTIIAVEKNKYIPSLELAFKIALIFDQPIEKIFIYNK
ncbi:transcriptional regulator [Candidatus Parcubacteria bacterium]|nr:MAG: transcriptional regulator [Candidatus Parcubacteria bacterium]